MRSALWNRSALQKRVDVLNFQFGLIYVQALVKAVRQVGFGIDAGVRKSAR